MSSPDGFDAQNADALTISGDYQTIVGVNTTAVLGPGYVDGKIPRFTVQ